MTNKLNVLREFESRAKEIREELKNKINEFLEYERPRNPIDFDNVGDDIVNGYVKKYIEIYYGVSSDKWLTYPKSINKGRFTFTTSKYFGRDAENTQYNVTYGKTVTKLVTNSLNALSERDLRNVWLDFCKDVFIPCEVGLADFIPWVLNVFMVGKDDLVEKVIEKYTNTIGSDVTQINLCELNMDTPYELYIFINKREY